MSCSKQWELFSKQCFWSIHQSDLKIHSLCYDVTDIVTQAGPITLWGTNSNCIHFICKISKHNVLSDNSCKRPGCFMTSVTRGAGSITVWGSNGCQQVVELIIRCQLGAHVSLANITQLPVLMLSVQLIDDICMTTKQEKKNVLMYLCLSTLNPSICEFHVVYLCSFIKYAQVAHAHLDLVSGHILLPPFLDCIQLIQQECISGNRTSPTVAINNMAFEMWRMGSGIYNGWNHTTHSTFMALGKFKLS